MSDTGQQTPPPPPPPQPPEDDDVEARVPTSMTKDFLKRTLTNATPGTSDATDHLGRAVQTGNKDYLGRLLLA